MQPYDGVWGDLQIGSYMRDKTGEVWKVIAERDFNFQVQNRAGVKKRLHPRDPKTPVTLMGATEAEAAKALSDVLGAQVLARREAGQTGWLCPAFPTTKGAPSMADARGHLWIAHGIFTGDVKRIEGMIECHDDDHADPGKGYQEHSHP